jgi:hypothetical protein
MAALVAAIHAVKLRKALNIGGTIPRPKRRFACISARMATTSAAMAAEG